MRRLSVLVLSLSLAACAKESKELTFPKNFIFGVATSGFQIEMGCPTIPASECEDPNSDWYQWITAPDDVKTAESIIGGPPSSGPGFYELYPEDLARAKNDLHLSGFRMGLEWSRVFPTSTKGIEGYDNLKAIANPKALAFYHRVFAELKKDGLVPLVTLNHQSLPLWIHDGLDCHAHIATCTKRGWLDDAIIPEIAKWAGFAAKEFGGEVDLWATINEPLATPLSGYLQPGKSRSNPPGLLLQGAMARTVVMNEIQAHAKMYDAIKANDTIDVDGDGKASMVGLVANLSPVYAADPTNDLDIAAAANTEYLYNELFLNALIDGKFDSQAAGAAAAVDRPDLARMDYLGVNYYSRMVVAGTTTPEVDGFSPLLTLDFLNPATNLFALYPPGIYETVKMVEAKYHHIPIYITETGTSQGANAADAPHDVIAYMSWLQKAIAEGADVRGVFYWTVTDNYEWNHGMEDLPFGLFAVDSKNPQKPRTLRHIGETYARIAQERKIPADFAKLAPTN
jgi:beta-glucosidase/6-phospho-beta-glucosidase/beta-galactosidase